MSPALADNLPLIPQPYRLDPFEVVTGYVGGFDLSIPPLPSPPAGLSPRRALESCVLRSVAKPPCVVMFSGGRDSSAVLALATNVARREGLPDPLPATNRFHGAPGTEEGKWQELVIRHLNLAEWVVKEWYDELDLIGPVAQQILRKWGPVYPFNVHLLVPLLDLAGGGSALTGVGGDQILMQGEALHAAKILTLQRRPRLQDWRTLAALVTPRSLRKRVRKRQLSGLAWLTDPANDRFLRTFAEDLVSEPTWFRASVQRSFWYARYRVIGDETLAILASERRVQLSHPFEEPMFISSVAAQHPWTGFASRDEAMTTLFDDLLPHELLVRHTKAGFNESLLSSYSLEFAKQWDGTGLDLALVKPESLRKAWLSETTDARSFSALQGAWYSAAKRNAR